MIQSKLEKWILLFEIGGFGLVSLLLWIDEIFDLPALFLGAENSPVNWRESILESILVLIIGAITILLTKKIIKKLQFLQGFLPVCAYCKRIRIDEQWIPLEEFVRANSKLEFSHSFCPDCAQKHYGEYFANSLQEIDLDNDQ